MDAPEPWRCIVVTGVSGSGKSTLAALLADRLGWLYAEGDDFHPAANIARMAAGRPLTDSDREPWLEAIARWIDARGPRTATVVTCSALRRCYRNRLAHGRPWLCFCHADAPHDVVARRLARRTHHFMPASLLDSQYAILDPLGGDEPGITVDATTSPEAAARAALDRLGLEGATR